MATITPSSSKTTSVDTIIVGNGPSALILSYILHGHIPYYDAENPHPDALLHTKLLETLPNPLLELDIDNLTDHFGASRFSYSTQALPVNVLLDTLIRPNGETEEEDKLSCIRWQYEPDKTVSHLIFGNTANPGGQWSDNPVAASWDIEALSYAEMLSLPGYRFAQHYEKHHGKPLPVFTRPCRREVAEYYATYPTVVGIKDVIRNNETIGQVSRTETGFVIGSHNISCKHLVLATGIFSDLIPPPKPLQPLLALPQIFTSVHDQQKPILIIGSGFTAADIILSAPKAQKIVHIYKWAPDTNPSPLRACHKQAYPEYAGIYRQMRDAALSHDMDSSQRRPKLRKGRSNAFLESRNWEQMYEGLPNFSVSEIATHDGYATVTLQDSEGQRVSREIGEFAYVVGRRGKLQYLSSGIQAELLDEGQICSVSEGSNIPATITGQCLRAKAFADIEVAPGIFVIGSLTGDSLVRFAYGGCVASAGKIIRDHEIEKRWGAEAATTVNAVIARPESIGESPRKLLSRPTTASTKNGGIHTNVSSRPASGAATPMMNGIAGHNDVPNFQGIEKYCNSPKSPIAETPADVEMEENEGVVPDQRKQNDGHSSLDGTSSSTQAMAVNVVKKERSAGSFRWSWQNAQSELMRFLRARA